MNYNEAIEYIHSVNWQFCKPGLERVSELCNQLGNPQDSLRFVHVAGTNGKGSFCSMLDSILRHSGLKVGLFTSPYIMEFNERMRINGENISDSELVSLVEEIRPICDSMKDKPTEFELITAIAFLYFARNKCDVVVLECGLGGRLDATNIITTPLLSVITGIALDHTSILGNTIPEIAAEKAGIIKKGVSVLWCGHDRDAQKVIEAKASEVGAPVLYTDPEELTVKEMSLDGTVLDFRNMRDLRLSLLGTYQPQNALNALTAACYLNGNGFAVNEDAIRQGLKSAAWPARFEIISRDPLIIADGGHNPEGVDAAICGVEKYFPGEKLGIVTGVMADKDYSYIAKRISNVAKKAFCLTPDNPRALSASDFARVFKQIGVESSACDSVNDAVAQAVSWAKETNTPVICLGSLYMYGDIRRALEKITK